MNSDSDDSDDSDIGALLDRAKKSKSRRTAASFDSDNDNDDDDNDEAFLIQSSSKKPKNMSVHEKLAVMDHEQKMSARKMENMWNSDSDSDTSDEEEKATTAPLGTPSQNILCSTRLRPRQQQPQQEVYVATGGQKPPARNNETVYDVYSSSDDDDDNNPATSEIPAEASRQLYVLRQARAQLQDQRPTIDVDDDQEVIAIDYDSPLGREIKLTVELSVDTNSEGLQKQNSIEVTMSSNDQLEVVQQAILRELQLPSDKKTTCRIRHGSQALRVDRTANDYGLESPCTLYANVFVTTWGNRAKPAAPKFGPVLVLYLRKGEDKTKIEYGLRQPFEELIQKHGKLHFDGEGLRPTSTPEDLDMENDDQIDVLA